MKYAIIGLGYIAERHLRAVKGTGGEVVLAYDRSTKVECLIVSPNFINTLLAVVAVFK